MPTGEYWPTGDGPWQATAAPGGAAATFATERQARHDAVYGVVATEAEARMAAREEAFVAAAQAANRAIWDGINQLVALQREWNGLDYGSRLDPVDGIPAADVGAVVFDTASALVAVLSAGHATNMAKLL
jgi:hypothetical protein